MHNQEPLSENKELAKKSSSMRQSLYSKNTHINTEQKKHDELVKGIIHMFKIIITKRCSCYKDIKQ